MSTTVFFVVMMLASGLTLLRGFAVAAVLSAEDFGLYATVVATGAFAGMLVSFGLIEQTWKAFPRLWARGEGRATVARSRRIDGRLLLRLAAVTLAAVPAGWAAWGGAGAVFVAWTGPFAAGVALGSSGSSFLRASGELGRLGRATFLRAALALVLSVALAPWLSWPGAVLGEVLAAAAFLGLVEHERRRLERSAVTVPAAGGTGPAAAERGGTLVYAAGLMTAAPIYLDRLFVRGLMDALALGSYAFLMLFNLGANTAVGIFVQKMGPQIVRMGGSGVPVPAVAAYLARWVLGTGLLVAAGIAVAALAVFLTPLDFLAAKYALTPGLFVAVGALCLGHVSVFLDWFLIARDMERWVLAAAAVLLAAMAAACTVLVVAPQPLAVLIWLFAAAKWAQVAVQAVGILRALAAAGRG